MDASPIPFAYEDHLVRAVRDAQGDPWFVAKDVCVVLELTGDAGQHVRRLDDDEKGLITNQTPGGPQEMVTISESGLYALIFTSRKPAARAFRKWVTAEVLPSLRRTGRYACASSASPDDPGGAHRRIKPGLRASALHAAVQVAKMSGGGESEVERLFERYCALFADRDSRQPEDCPWPGDSIYEQMDRFADECVVETPGAKTRAKDVWDMFLRWWASQGEGEQPSWQMLGRHLGRRYCKYKRGGVVNYHGVSVRRPHCE